MLSRDNIIRIVVSVNIVSWLLLLGLNLTTLLQGYDKTAFGVPVVVRGLLLNLFLVLVFFFFQARYEENSTEGFVDRLIRLLDTAWVLALVSILFRFGDFLLDYFFQAHNAQLALLFYHVQIGLVTIFLTKTFFVWKRFVLYQRSRKLLLSWQLFEYALLASLFFNFFLLDSNSTLLYFLLVPLAVGGVVLSFNLRWVAYLTVPEKWKAILLMFLLGLFCAYFFWTLDNYSGITRLVTDLVHSVYILALFVFVGGYSLISFAVLLFNLPTSVVFEQKVDELLDFQKLTQTFQIKGNESQVYETLLDSTVKAAGADAAWLVVANESRQITHLLTRSLPRQRALHIEKAIAKQINYTARVPVSQNIRREMLDGAQEAADYRSVLMVPLIFQEKAHGTLGLLKSEKDGFSSDSIELINTFARMTGVAIENFRLVSKAIENERYQESLRIAKIVQQKLLPAQFPKSEHFEISAFSESGDEVGGDYYDFFQLSEHRTVLIIGDVSGKGTSAAFHMAQMKGIFHSLVELHLAPHRFLALANNALSRCLDKNQFMTASVFMINQDKQTVLHARGGHCPAIHYQHQTGSATLLETKGLGLGLLRRPEYASRVSTQTLHYQPGDWLILYTDGILEARNPEGEEFGEDHLLAFVKRNAVFSSEQFTTAFWAYFRQFCGNAGQEDDYTLVAVKFSETPLS